MGPKVPHATIRGPWTSNRTSKLEARHSTGGTPRLESVVLGFCCINWPFRHSTWRHQMTPMDPLFPRSAKRGRRRGSPALLTLMMMGGAPYLHGPPVPAAQVDIVPAFRIQSRDMCNPPTREASEDASWQGEATSVRSDQDGMPRASSAEAKSTLFLFRDLDRSGLGTHVSWLLLASSSSKPSMPLAWECAWPCRRLDSGCLGTVSRPPRTLPFTAHSAECPRSSGGDGIRGCRDICGQPSRQWRLAISHWGSGLG